MFVQNDNYILRDISDIPLLICRKKTINDIWIFELNTVGRILWENCNYCKDNEELIERIQSYFTEEITLPQKEMIIKFMTKLIDIGLVKEDV